MRPDLDRTLRRGGMSRRGFLRLMGVTTAAVVVPGGLVRPWYPKWNPRTIIMTSQLIEIPGGSGVIGYRDDKHTWRAVYTLPGYIIHADHRGLERQLNAVERKQRAMRRRA